ncbi:alpha/beta-hydrolase [Trametopsis cervina]|nr:alpha/beta-hydrolase [Trametopsis cervina]
MTDRKLRPMGCFAIYDTGVPTQNTGNYTTLFLLHGFGSHNGTFARILPFAEAYNCRIVLVNRRDFPSATPLSEGDRRPLDSALSIQDKSMGLHQLLQYTEARAIETHDAILAFVRDAALARKSVIIAGHSFGTVWMMQFLAHAHNFAADGMPLYEYITRVVAYDPPYHALGFPPPAAFYNPLTDPSHSHGEGIKLFPVWVSGYYAHGNSPDTLEHRTPLEHPRPTLLTMTPEEVSGTRYLAPGAPGGSDQVLMQAGIQHGLFASLRERALYLSPTTDATQASSDTNSYDGWDSVELRYLWCDESPWEIPWGTWALQNELEDATKAGKRVRRIEIVRLTKANHFAHWDQPERTLKALLAEQPGEDTCEAEISSNVVGPELQSGTDKLSC